MLRDVLTRRVLAAAARAAKDHATPFYLFDSRELLRQARAWRRAAEAIRSAGVFYPYKCNRVDPVIGLLAREGLGAEVTSLADFRHASRLGLEGERLVVQGPAKSRELLDAGLAAGALFVADGREDALALLDRARALSIRPRYLLRLAPLAADAEQRGFGLPARQMLVLAREISLRGAPAPDGLAFHLGTGISRTDPYLRALEETAKVAGALTKLGIAISLLDLGGGFAARSEYRFDARNRPQAAGKDAGAILPALAGRARRLLGRDVPLLFEPGRALVSGSFHLVARVVRVRAARPRTTVYLDASHLSHALFITRRRHPIAAIPRRRGIGRAVALAGPLGVGLDVFAPSVRLQRLQPGDLVVIGSVGAYNVNAANTWTGPIPPVISLRPLSPRERAGVRA
ncbi:MAG: hypothetical protein ACRD3M_04135 [Thermoanaerobaculia bacterium]